MRNRLAMRRFPLVKLLTAAGALLPWPAWAQQPPPRSDTLHLTLPQAQTLALRRSPSFFADAQMASIARGELREARQFPNPELELEAPGISRTSLGSYQAILGQSIEWAGQRGLRVVAAEHGVTRALGEVRNAARELILEVSLAYVQAAATDQRLEIAESALELNQSLLAAVRSQLQEGKISPLDANLAEIEFGRARAHVLAARRESAGASADLKGAIGLEPEQRIQLSIPEDPVEPSLPPEDSLVTAALRQRPDVAASTAAVDQATAALRLSRREAVPPLTIGPMAERDENSGSPKMGLALGMPLPLWNRNGAAAAQQEAELARARFDLDAVELAVRREVGESLRALSSAREEVDVFRGSVLEPARENQQLLEIAYREGKIDLVSLLLVRSQLLDAETEYWDAWLAREEARLRLRAATASFDPGALATEGGQ